MSGKEKHWQKARIERFKYQDTIGLRDCFYLHISSISKFAIVAGQSNRHAIPSRGPVISVPYRRTKPESNQPHKMSPHSLSTRTSSSSLSSICTQNSEESGSDKKSAETLAVELAQAEMDVSIAKSMLTTAHSLYSQLGKPTSTKLDSMHQKTARIMNDMQNGPEADKSKAASAGLDEISEMSNAAQESHDGGWKRRLRGLEANLAGARKERNTIKSQLQLRLLEEECDQLKKKNAELVEERKTGGSWIDSFIGG